MSDLVNRLRGIYNIAVDPKVGPLDGKMTFTRTFGDLPPIMGEAANRIEELEAFVSDAFKAHPNLDLDVDNIREPHAQGTEP